MAAVRTPRNIMRHELIGLHCEVVASGNRSQIGTKGRIIDETLKTLVIKTEKSQKRIQKQGCVFRVALDEHVVDIDGDYMVARPEDRIKKKFSKW